MLRRLLHFCLVTTQVNCLVYSEGILLVGCADGGLRLIPIQNGTEFGSKPSMWPAICGKSSPGVSTINITYTMPSSGYAGDTAAKCICCAGAEDGSVALFELSRVLNSSGGGFLS